MLTVCDHPADWLRTIHSRQLGSTGSPTGGDGEVDEPLAGVEAMRGHPVPSEARWILLMRTDTFLGQRYRRLARRRGKKRAIVAVGRSILVIIWHLLSDDQAHYLDLGSGYYESRINLNRRMRNHVRELQALGYRVTLEPAA